MRPFMMTKYGIFKNGKATFANVAKNPNAKERISTKINRSTVFNLINDTVSIGFIRYLQINTAMINAPPWNPPPGDA
jgi:hypothetical protein